MDLTNEHMSPTVRRLRRLRPRRLHTLIAVLGALLFAIVIGVHTWYSVGQQTEAETVAVEARVIALADSIATASAGLLVTHRYSEIDDLVARIARFPDVLRIQLIDPAGHVLSDVERSPGHDPQLIFDAGHMTPPTAARVLRGSHGLVVWHPINVGTLIGWVRIEYSLNSVKLLESSIVHNAILVGSLSIAIGALLFWVALRQPMQAVERATRFAARLDALRGRPYQADRGIHEVEQLGEALNNVSLKLAEQEQALASTTHRLQSVLQNAIDGILTIDQSGRIESVNPAAERIFGYKHDELLGQPFTRLVPDFFTNVNEHAHSPDGETYDVQMESEMPALRKDASSFPLRVGLSAIRVDGVVLFIAIVRDITEQKQLEHMKNSFVSSVSHELRTPLTTLHGAMSLLASGEVEGIGERAGRLLKLAFKNSSRLVRLVNDILDFESLESGRMKMDARVIDVAPLVEQAIVDSEECARLRDVTLTFDAGEGGATVFVDGERLTRVFVNLIASAVHLSGVGEEVRVGIERVGGLLRIGVTHRGPGIPEEARKFVFQKFLHVNIEDPHYQAGIGLSLSLAKAIVERFAGRVDFESGPDGETLFVELPEAVALRRPAHVEAAEPARVQRLAR